MSQQVSEYPQRRLSVPTVFTRTATTDVQPEKFTREHYEEALDKVSRPLKGRLAHVPYSSEDFIREKREEAELEDRSS